MSAGGRAFEPRSHVQIPLFFTHSQRLQHSRRRHVARAHLRATRLNRSDHFAIDSLDTSTVPLATHARRSAAPRQRGSLPSLPARTSTLVPVTRPKGLRPDVTVPGQLLAVSCCDC